MSKQIHWSNRSHPMWIPINMAVIGIILYLCLKATASHFDITEWKTIGGVVGGIGGFKTAEHWLKIYVQKSMPALEGEADANPK